MHDDWGVRSPRWEGVRSEVVDVRDTAVHLLRVDAAPGAEGERPQLFVHGLGGAALNWLEVLPSFASRGPVFAPDLPGFGRTEPPDRRASRIRAQVGFLAALLDTLGLDEVDLHANSMGGLIATLFAAAHPERVARLILVDPALPGPRKQLHRLDRTTLVAFSPFVVPPLGRLMLGRLYSNRTTEQLLDRGLHHVHADAARLSPELREAALDNLRYGQETTWRLDGFAVATASIVEMMLVSSRVRRAIDQVQAPTLVLWGEHDALIGRPVIDRLAAQRPDWELRVLPEVGHMVAMEAPEVHRELVHDWLDRVPGGPGLKQPA